MKSALSAHCLRNLVIRIMSSGQTKIYFDVLTIIKGDIETASTSVPGANAVQPNMEHGFSVLDQAQGDACHSVA